MALPPEVGDREVQKFVETDAGDVAVRVLDAAGNAIDDGNSSLVELPKNGQFTGTWLDVSSYHSVQVSMRTDHKGTLFMEWATVNTATGDFDWDFQESFDNPGGKDYLVRRNHRAQYYRTRYLNDGFAQVDMKLTTFQGDFNAPFDAQRLRGKSAENEFVDAVIKDRLTAIATADTQNRILLERICEEMEKQTALLEQITE